MQCIYRKWLYNFSCYFISIRMHEDSRLSTLHRHFIDAFENETPTNVWKSIKYFKFLAITKIVDTTIPFDFRKIKAGFFFSLYASSENWITLHCTANFTLWKVLFIKIFIPFTLFAFLLLLSRFIDFTACSSVKYEWRQRLT